MSRAQTVPDPRASRENFMRFLLRFTSARSEETKARLELMRVKAFLKTYFRTQLPRLLLTAGIGFAIGWLLNVYLLAVKYQGYNIFPPKTKAIATGKGSVVVGMLFWFVAGLVVAGLIGFRRKAGKQAFMKRITALPTALLTLVQKDRDALPVHLLWGLAGSLLVMIFAGTALTGLVAAGFLVSFLTVFRRLISSLLTVGWRAVVRRIAPDRAFAPVNQSAAAIASIAGVAAMLVGWVVSSSGIRVVLALAAGIGAYVLGQQRAGNRRAAATAMLFAPFAIVAALSLAPDEARADDGGTQECTGQTWITCPGSDDVLGYGALGGAAAAAGAAAGDAAGSAAGEEDDDDDDDDEDWGGGGPPCEEEEAGSTASEWDAWQAAHPDGSWDEFMAERIAHSRAEAEAKGAELDMLAKEVEELERKTGKTIDEIRAATAPDKPWQQMNNVEKHESRKRITRAWMASHPNGNPQELQSMLNRFDVDPDLTSGDMLMYVLGESAIGLPGATWNATKETLGQLKHAPAFIKDVADSYWEELGSGEQADRLGRTFVDPIGNLVQDFQKRGASAMLADVKASGIKVTAAGAKQFDTMMQSLHEAMVTGDAPKIAKVIDGIGGTLLSDYLLTLGTGRIMRTVKGGMKLAGGGKGGLVDEAVEVIEGTDEIPLDTPAKRRAAGFSEDANKGFQDAADKHGNRLQMQKRDPSAVDHEGSAYMKSQNAKDMKSVGKLDAELGGPDQPGLLAFYQPKNPLAAAGSPIQKRYELLNKLYNQVPGADLQAKQAYLTKHRLEVWVNGDKVQIPVSFDSKGVMRHTQTGRPIVSDYDGWAVLDSNGRRLGYADDGTKLTGSASVADRKTKVPMIRDLVDDPRTQLQHAPASSEWGPVPALLAGTTPCPSFACKIVAIGENIVNSVKDGVVEFRPGGKHPVITKPAGVKDAGKPTLKLPPPKSPTKTTAPTKTTGPKGTVLPRPPSGGGDDSQQQGPKAPTKPTKPTKPTAPPKPPPTKGK